MWIRLAAAVLVATGSLAAALSAQPSAQPPGRVDFARDVQPVLRQNCYGCHGPTQQKNGLRLDRRRDAMRGGTIAVIGPGNSEASRLYLRLVGDRFGLQMPPTGALPPDQIAIIKAWIDQGAEWPDELSGETPPLPADPRATRLIGLLRAGDRRAFGALAAADPAAANLRGPGGSTPLMFAVLYGEASDVAFLLDHGADPNIKNDAGATGLMWAVTNVEMTQLLLDHGAQINVVSGDARTPLLAAAGTVGASPVVKLLLDHGANVSVKGPGVTGDITPILAALRAGDEASFRLLIEHGVNIGAPAAPTGPGPLFFALRARCMSCVDSLLSMITPASLSSALLADSPPRGRALDTTLLLDRGADPKAVSPDGETALMLAAASDVLPADAAAALIARGADVNAKSRDGRTALGLAMRHGRTPVVDVLLKAGAAPPPPLADPGATPSPAASPRAAIARSLPLLQRTDATFLEKSGCVSCHHDSLTAATIAAARSRGLQVDEAVARKQLKLIGAYLDSWRERALQGVGIPGESDTVSYILFGLAAERYPADAATDAMARYLKSQQAPNGQWRIFAYRPPVESSDMQVTATSMRALQLYAPAAPRSEYRAAIARAAAWIAEAKPDDTEGRAFQMLGLAWSKAPGASRASAARALIAEQRPDGGWAQIPSLASDAYATGQALVALAESGAISTSAPAYQRGIRFLLNSQFEDGSWFVRTRALPIQPYFESGFPYGRDQFISAAATNWATRALALAYVKPS